MFKMSKLVLANNILVIIIAALLSAFALHIFVYPASFSPSGIDGIATMLQSKIGFNAGYTTFILNLPLLVIAWFSLKHKYVIYCLIYTVITSVAILILSRINFYQYHANSNLILPAIFSGLILGLRTGLMIKIGSSTGGIDIIAGLMQKNKPHRNIEFFISFLSYIIVIAAFFVYNNSIEAVMLTIVQIYCTQKAIGGLLKASRSAVEFKVITKNPQELKSDIISIINHSATLVETQGMFSGEKFTMIICIVNTYQIGDFLKVVKNHKDTFAVFSDINGVSGNFRWLRSEQPK